MYALVKSEIIQNAQPVNASDILETQLKKGWNYRSQLDLLADDEAKIAFLDNMSGMTDDLRAKMLQGYDFTKDKGPAQA